MRTCARVSQSNRACRVRKLTLFCASEHMSRHMYRTSPWCCHQLTSPRCCHHLTSTFSLRYDSNQLDKAVTPGPTANTDTHDYMFTTPNRLFAVLDGTIRAFDAMQVRDLEGNPDEDRGLSDRLSLEKTI